MHIKSNFLKSYPMLYFATTYPIDLEWFSKSEISEIFFESSSLSHVLTNKNGFIVVSQVSYFTNKSAYQNPVL